jgi:dGTP triphosphohydrolase
MNWADDVAYSAHDLEDAMIIGTIGLQELANDATVDAIVRRAITAYSYEWPKFVESEPLSPTEAREFVDRVAGVCLREPASAGSDRLKVIKTFTAAHINECVTKVQSKPSDTPEPERYARDLDVPSLLAKRVEVFKAIAHHCVIKSTAVVTLQQAGRRIVADLFSSFAFLHEPELDYDFCNIYPIDWQASALAAVTTDIKNNDHEGRSSVKRLARDYVSSMTDSQAESTWRRLFMPEGGPLFVAKL